MILLPIQFFQFATRAKHEPVSNGEAAKRTGAESGGNWYLCSIGGNERQRVRVEIVTDVSAARSGERQQLEPDPRASSRSPSHRVRDAQLSTYHLQRPLQLPHERHHLSAYRHGTSQSAVQRAALLGVRFIVVFNVAHTRVAYNNIRLNIRSKYAGFLFAIIDD